MQNSKVKKTNDQARFIFYGLFFGLVSACGGGGNIGSKLDVPPPKLTPQISVFVGSPGRFGGVDGPSSLASFTSPKGVAVDQFGNIFVADYICVIRKIASTGLVSTFAGSIFPSPDVVCSNAEFKNGFGASAVFHDVDAVAVGPTGTVYVADQGTVRMIDDAGNVSTLAGSPYERGDFDGNGPDASFSNPVGIAVSKIGNVYVADAGSGRIRKIALSQDVTTVVNLRKRNEPDNIVAIAIDSLENLYVVNQSKNELYKIKAENNVVTTLDLGVGVAPLSKPAGVAVDSKGNIFVSDAENHVIRKISKDGSSAVFAGEFGVSGARDGVGIGARFSDPRGLAADSLDNIYVADTNGTVRKITPLGFVTTVGGSAEVYGSDDGIGSNATFGQGYYSRSQGSTNGTGNRVNNGVSQDSHGNFYVADTFNHVIRKISEDRRVSTIAGKAGERGSSDGQGGAARFSFPTGIVVDIDDSIYVTDTENNTIRKVTVDGSVSTIAGTPLSKGGDDGVGASAKFNHPNSIALDPRGFLIVSDTDNQKLRKISKTGVVTSIQSSLAPDYPLAAVADRNGNHFFITLFCPCIFKTDVNGVTTKLAGGNVAGRVDGKGSAARFDSPIGLSLDDLGNLYTLDAGAIRKVTTDGVVTTIEIPSNRYYLGGNFVFRDSTLYSMSEIALFQILNAR